MWKIIERISYDLLNGLGIEKFFQIAHNLFELRFIYYWIRFISDEVRSSLLQKPLILKIPVAKWRCLCICRCYSIKMIIFRQCIKSKVGLIPVFKQSYKIEPKGFFFIWYNEQIDCTHHSKAVYNSYPHRLYIFHIVL